MAGLRLFVALPSFPVCLVFLVGGQPIHTVSQEDAMDGGHGHRYRVKTPQVVGNASRAEMIVLPQIQYLADDIAGECAWRPLRSPRPVTEAGRPGEIETLLPFVERFP